MNQKKINRMRRAKRGRMKMRELGMTRLSVNRTPRHIYAQVIDDVNGVTIASASTKEIGKDNLNVEIAKEVGKKLAENAKSAGVETVIFDRGGYPYHGRVKSLAEGAREGGLKF